MKKVYTFILLTLIPLFLGAAPRKQGHPVLLLTPDGVEQMKAHSGEVPLFDNSVASLIAEADAALKAPLCLPEPKDGGGGYSHEMHKRNYYDMFACGMAWQLTSEKKYAEKVREILLAYADMYPTLGYHPMTLSKVPGRIFWQTLNESVWLVHTSIAYDCVRDYLSAKDRRKIEDDLLRLVADFIMNGTPDYPENNKIFNKMHNHGTWACAAVGMAGMSMDDDDLIDKALYGSDKTGSNGGFIRQLDFLFSPDGYFTEGAYYQRYAIWPFVTFAQCIAHYRPEMGIFGYRDAIILKAVDTLLQMSYDGVFLRFNDALEKGFDAQELIYAVDIAYNADKTNKSLLSVAKDYQNKVLVSDAGYAVAKGIADGEAEPIRYRSLLLRDGMEGNNGALALMRSKEGLNSLVSFKATSHGLSHGHYDKLTFAYYDNDHEIITDYGASRFINIEAKYKGHYTKQNKSYAMTTVAHNTVTVDGKSHFNGNFDRSSQHNPDIWHCDLENQDFQIVSAFERNAAPGVEMFRTVAYARIPFLEYPLIMDVFSLRSADAHQYDYPIHYNGHMISLDVPYEKSLSQMGVLGEKNGYNHLWVEAKAKGGEESTCYTWLTGDRMYSLSLSTTPQTEVFLARTGADDPDFNLRSEPLILFRENGRADHIFAGCIETHGRYDLQVEQSENLVHSCKGVRVWEQAGDIVAEYSFIGGRRVLLCIAGKNLDREASHSVSCGEGTVNWKGPKALITE